MAHCSQKGKTHMQGKLKILFLCTGNSCRSQMAEGWARHLHADKLEPYSAGVEKHGLNSYAVQVMTEAGVNISSHFSKLVDELPIKKFDVVVTVCDHANEQCPFFPGNVKRIHASFPDPPQLAAQAATADEKLDCYRRVRDEIRDFVLTLPQSLI